MRRPADLPLAYAFEPGSPDDGVTVDVPVALLHRLSPEEFLRQVPGRREEVVTALVRSLPKALRTRFVPVPDTVRAVLPALDEGRDLPDALAAALTRHGGFPVPATAFDLGALPDHLRMTFRVVDEAGAEVGRGRDLVSLRAELGTRGAAVAVRGGVRARAHRARGLPGGRRARRGRHRRR